MTARRTIGALLLAAVLALAGCGRDEGGGDGAAEQSKAIAEGPATGEITVWAMGTEGELLPKLAAEFQKDNPDATVKVTAVPWDGAHDKIATAIAGRQTPDVSLLGTTWMGEFASGGGLDPVPADLVTPGDFFEGPWNTVAVKGTPYGVPWYTDTRVLYYRKDLAAKAGVQAPTTWEELKTFVKALQDQGGAKYGTYLQPSGRGTWQTLAPFVWQAGGDMVNDPANPTEYTLDTPQWTEALEFQKSFYDEKLSQATALQPGEIESKFAKGSWGRSSPARGTLAWSRTRGSATTSSGWPSCRRSRPAPRSWAAATWPCSRTPRTATAPGSSSSGWPGPRPSRAGTTPPRTCRPSRPPGRAAPSPPTRC